MFLCCDYTEPGWSISDFADLANIVIAGFSLFLAYYIFVYQKSKDKIDKAEIARKEQEAKIDALNLQEQNIRLQWFKELIVQPHLNEINQFYSNLHSIEHKLSVASISEELKIDVAAFIKSEQAKLRKTFIDVLRAVNPHLHSEIKTNLDSLIDNITNAIFNQGLNLNNKATFDKEIGSLISYSHNDLVSKIYNYKGI